MIRLSALNDNSSDESEPERTQESIKQAQESEALELYNKALQYQHSEDHSKAEETYQELLLSALVTEAPTPDPDEGGLHHPGQVLKYSAYKNLAVLAENKGEYEKATDNYLEAVMLDDSDVTVWYHIGKVSIKCFNLTLARQAFEEGLRCNSKHWPCLDELCTVLYAIGDYPTCLAMVSDALEEDESYLKGLALRDKIFKEEPYLKRDYRHLRSLYLTDIEEDDATKAMEFVKEALHLREERLKLIEATKADPPPVNPVKPLTSYTWAALGDCFIVLYDHMTSPENPQSLGRVVNLDDYYKAIVTPDISMPHKASLSKVSDSLAGSSFSTEGFGVYKSAGSSDNDEKAKKAPKRKKPPSSGLENDFPPKRRSARVRTSKKKEEETNYKDLIQTFLPFSLRAIVLGDDESSQDSFGESQQSTPSQSALQEGKVLEKGQSSEYEDVISGEAETLDVLTFVKEHMTNGGLLDLMTKFGICLAAQRNKKWPPALADVFVKVYTRLRKHIMLPSEFIREEDEVYTGELAKVILVATELTLDKLLTAKSKSSSSLSPASSPRGGQAGVSPIRVGPGFSSKFLANDIEYLHCIALDKTIHGDGWLEFAIRVNWAKARYLMLQGQMEIAMLYLDRCTKLLAIEVSPLSEPMTVKLVNCKIDNNVTLEQVHKKLESLQRCQSLEEVHRLYELGHYEDVVQLLIPTLHQPQPKTKASELGMSIPERPAQLLLLQDSLIKLKDFRRCLECSEVALNEAVSQMSPCEAWSTTLSRLFQCMNTCIEELKTILDGFPQSKLTSLTLNIIKVIEASIYSSDVSMEPPLATAYPWVLLYKIIKNKEKDEDMDVDPPAKPDTPVQSTSDNAGTGDADNTSASNDSPSLPSSLQFLRTAHEQLGRRGWCCNNDGIFLLLSVDALTQQLAKPFMSSREDIVRDLEQCFLCLYGHPSKKAKLRGLQEHSSCQMPLTWQNSALVFNYFKPSELPTFDAKTYTISTEVQNLMRRITLVVPPQELEAILFDNVQAFIDGLSDEVPKLPESLVTKERPVVGELFYLLADFYFKNKEFSKALKFYTHDICVKPNRSDSWAAMALIRKSRLESKLNACEPKSAGPIQKHAVAALKCFKRAMETDSTNSSILEEYGSLCYFLHSHASRQLKQFDQEEVSVETRSSLLQRKLEMLHLSEEIFSNALGMDDSEAWLHHYMLGKIAEKLKKPPQVYLEHYAKSARFLDDDIKYYPRKIPFYSPPEHVLEALEVYYRIHVSVLKLVLKDFRNIDKVVLEKHLQLAAKGPFFQPEQDADGAHSIVTRTESTTSEISSESEKEPEKEPSAKKHPIVHQPDSALKEDAKGKDDIQSTEKTKDPISVTSAMEVDKVPEMITVDLTSIGSVSSDKKICDQDASKENKEGKTPQEKESDENKNIEEESKGEIDDVTQSSSSEPLKSEKDEEQKEHAIKITGSPCKDSIFTSDEKVSESKAVFETQNYQSEPVDIVMKEDEDNTTVKPQETRQIDKEQEKTLVQEVSQFDTNEVDQALSSSLLSPKMPTISNEFQEEVPLERPQLEQQTEDVEMKEEKTSTESVKIQEDLVLKNEPTPMETEDIISAKETNDVVQKNVETGEEQAKSETATDSYSMKENFPKELPEKTAVPSSAPASSMSGMDKDDVPLTIKEEEVEADDSTPSLPKEVALNEPPSIDRNVDTVMTNEKASNIEKKEKPRSVAESIEIKEQPDVDMSSKCDASVIPTPQTVGTGMIKTSALDDTSNNRQKDDVEMKTQATNLDDAASSIKSTEIPLTTSPSNDASMKSSGLSLTEIPNQSTDALSTNSCEPPLNDVQKQTQRELLDICIHGLEHCLQRFPQHHKSRYRLAFVNYVSPYSKDVQASRALLLGGNTGKAKLSRNPQQGLFNEKSKTNLFSAFWRIPEEDIDRPGSFCTHTYKSVDLMLQVLKELCEWDSLLNISNLLHRTPEAGKKYLRDNERHFLAKKACEFMVDIVSKLTEAQDPQSDPSSLSQLVLDTYECWKLGQKYDHTAKVSENLLIKSFELYRAKVPESPVTPGETQLPVLERALRFCQQVVKPQTSSVSTAPQTPVESSLDSQNDDVIMQEQPSDVIQSPTSITADQQETISRSKDVKGRLSTEDLLKSVDIKKRLLSLKDDISSKTANDSENVMLQPTGGVTRVVLKHPVSGAKIGNLLPLTITIDKLNIPPTSAKTSVTSASISVTSSNPVTVAVSKEVSKSQPTSLISTLSKTSVPCTSLSTSIRIVTSKDPFTGITSISTLPKTSVPSASQVQSVRIVTASKDSITGATGDQVPPITSASNLPMTSLPTASQAQSVRIVTSKAPVASRSGDKVPPTTSTLLVSTSPVSTTPSTATSIDTTSTSNLVKKDFLITSTTLSGPLTTASSDTISKPITAVTSMSTAPSKIPVSLGLSEVLGSRSVLAATTKLQTTTAATHVLLKGPIISSTSNTALHYPSTVSAVISNYPVMSATTNTQSNVKITTANIPEKSKPSLSTSSCIVSSNARAATSSIIPGVAASSNAPFITIESDTTSKIQAPKTTGLELIKASITSATTVAASNSPVAKSTSVDISSVRVTSQVLPDAPVPSTSTIAVSSLVAAKSSSEDDSRVQVTSAARQVLPDSPVPSTSTIAVSSLVAAKSTSEDDSRVRVTSAARQVLPDGPAPSAVAVSNVSVTSSTNVAPTKVKVTPASSHTSFKIPVSTAASIAGSQTITPDASHTISSASTAASNLNVSVIASQQLTNTLVPTTAPTAAGVLVCTSTTSDASEPTQSSSPMKSIGIFHDPAPESSLGLSHSLEKLRPSSLTQEKEQSPAIADSIVSPSESSSVGTEVPSRTKTSPVIERSFPAASKPKKELTALKMEKLESKIARLKHAAEVHSDVSSSTNIPAFLQPSKPTDMHDKNEEENKKD